MHWWDTYWGILVGHWGALMGHQGALVGHRDALMTDWGLGTRVQVKHGGIRFLLNRDTLQILKRLSVKTNELVRPLARNNAVC